MLERIVEDLANRVLSMDPTASERLASLHGSTVVVAFSEAPLPPLLFEFVGDAICVDKLDADSQDEQFDLRLSATPIAYLRAGLASDTGDLTGYGIHVSGDIEVAGRFVALVRHLDIDWEDELAKRVGDVPARALTVFARRGRDWSREARTALTDNIGDFLKEESGEVPLRADIEGFLDDVDAMRNRVDSVEVRIAALERRRTVTGGAS